MGEKTKRDATYFESIDGTLNYNNNINKKESIKELVILRESDSVEGTLSFKSNIGATSNSNSDHKSLKNSSFVLSEALTEAENKLLGLANIALERETN